MTDGDRGDGRCSIPEFHDHPGISERRHSGPAKATWYEVLGVSADAPCEVIDTAGKAMRRKTHPDAAAAPRTFQQVQDAIAESNQ